MPSLGARTVPAFLITFGCAYALIALVSGEFHLWNGEGLKLAAGSKSGLVTAGVIVGFGVLLCRQLRAPLETSLTACAAALAFLLVTDWTTHSYSFFQGPTIRGEVLLGVLLAAWMVYKKEWSILSLLLPLSAAIIAWSFLTTSGGRLLFSDDHPSFLFRLYALKAEFPSIPFYYPGWNAGLDARDFFATGSLGVFLVFSPLLTLFDPQTIYNVIVLLILCVITPGASYLAARLMALPHLPACVAGILALSSSLNWYKWALKYGTLGFVLSMSLLPLVLVLAGRFYARQELSKRDAILLPAVGTLCLLWPASLFALVPAILGGLLGFRLIVASRLRQRVLIALILINLPWMIVFATVSRVGAFIEASPASHQEPAASTVATTAIKEAPSTITAERIVRNIRIAAISAHPLLLIFSLPGLLLLRRPYRTIIGSSALWLLVLGSMLTFLRPQLELERMLVVLTLLGALPTAQAFATMLDRYQRGMTVGFAPILSIACLLTGPFAVAGIVHNRTLEQYAFAGPVVNNLTASIREFAGAGRTVFTGFVLHELSGGHIAPLSFMTEHPLVASSPFHNAWRYQQVVPKSFIERGDAGVIEFLDLMNATLVVAHEEKWRELFLSRGSEFERVWQEPPFMLFQRRGYVPSYFAEGAGELTVLNDALRVILSTPDATLKFRWFPFLRASHCKMERADAAPELPLIRLTNCPTGVPITISSASTIERVLLSYGIL